MTNATTNRSTTPRPTLSRFPKTMSRFQWSGFGGHGRENSALMQIVGTLLYAATIAVGFTVLAFVFEAHSVADWIDPHRWAVRYAQNLFVSTIISFTIQGLLVGGRKVVGEQRLRSFKPWQRWAFFGGLPLLGTAVGWIVGVSLLVGNLRFLREMTPNDIMGTLALAALISALFFIYFSLMIRRVRAEMRANEAQLRLLQGQMEPHFLFNTLANVISLIDIDPAHAKHVLEAFTDYLRVSLGSLRRNDSTLGAELDLATRFLQLMQTRMGERLRFEIDVDASLRGAALPPLLLQPLIENAVKHGLEPQVDGGTVRVKAARVKVGGVDSLQLCVDDDGAGLAASATRKRRTVAGGADSNGIAVANLRERLQTQFGTQGSLTLTDLASPSGTRSCLIVPWQTPDAAPQA